MKQYTIELTDAEAKAMESVVINVQDWADNFLKNRARIAMDEIYQSEVQRMNEDSTITLIPADKEAVVLSADVKSALSKNLESEAEIQNLGE